MPRIEVGKVIGWLRRLIEIFDYGRAREWWNQRGGASEGSRFEQPSSPASEISKRKPSAIGRQR